MKRWIAVTLSLVVVGVLAGCGAGSGDPAKTVQVTAANMSFDTKELTLDKGKAVKLVFNNQDSQLHDFSIDKIPAKVKESHSEGMHDMGATMPDVHTSADPGKTGEVEFTPTQSGTYVYYCTVPGHKDAGMQGTLIVK